MVNTSDGNEALARARDLRPDLVVTDVIMPGMDGLALCRALRADGELVAVPVILLTALATPEDVLIGLEAGAGGFITKPCDHDFLIGQVRRRGPALAPRSVAARRPPPGFR